MPFNFFTRRYDWFRAVSCLGCISFGLSQLLQAGSPAVILTQETATLKDLTTDRPDKTESPITVDKGYFQIEAELFTWTRDREDGVRFDGYDVGIINFKYGITEFLDFQVAVESYHWEKTQEGGRSARTEGFGDLTLRSKINFWGNSGNERSAFGLIPYVKLPTAKHAAGIAKAEAGLIVPFALSLTDRLGLGLMTEVDWVNDEDGGHTWQWVNSASLSIGLTDRLGMYVELYTEIPMENTSAWVATADSGFTFQLSENVQWDIGVNVGLTDTADDLQLFTGISYRF